VRSKLDREALRLRDHEPKPAVPPAPTPEPESDAAESRWDPWLLALAKLEAEEEAPRPN
jgi:hypothetical protein